jgi:hypothetical protein
MGRDQDGVDKDFLLRPEDEDSFEEQENAEERTAEGATDTKEDEEEEEEYDLYRLERLLRLDQSNKLPSLNPQHVFEKAGIDRSVLPINKKEFDTRLKYFLVNEDPHIPPLSSELANFLFDRSVDAHGYIAAWDIIVKNRKSPEFDRTRRYLRKELNRYLKIRSLLAEKRPTTPNWMSSWTQCWVGAFEEIREEIESQLRTAIYIADNVCQKRTSVRFEMNSYILWDEKNKIRGQIAGTPFARKLEVVLAAFAYAAKLVPEPRNGIAGYVALIKQRVSRVSRSEIKRIEVQLSILRTMLAMQYEESDPKASS